MEEKMMGKKSRAKRREKYDDLNWFFGNEAEGRKEMWKYIKKKRLTQKEAIIAKCCACMALFMFGKRDCTRFYCPLYPFMPYRKKN